MKVIYYEPSRLPLEVEQTYHVQYRPFDNLLAESDFVTVHAAFSSSTRHLISTREFSLMKESVFLINAARGPIVDERALINALRKKKIAGCGLDVFEREPKIFSELTKMENVVLLPHIGSATMETRTKMGLMAVENLIAVLIKNSQPSNIVNPEVL